MEKAWTSGERKTKQQQAKRNQKNKLFIKKSNQMLL